MKISGRTHWQSGVQGPMSSPPATTGETATDATTAAIATILATVIMVKESVGAECGLVGDRVVRVFVFFFFFLGGMEEEKS